MAIDVALLTKDVQDFLQDDPQLNVLLGKREFSPAMVRLAIRMMVDDFNQVNFVSGYTEKDFPTSTLNLQVYGTIYHLLNSATTLQLRNHLPYNDSGLSVAQFSKSGEYAAVADRFKALFDEKALQVKYDINVRAGEGNVPSEYSYGSNWANIAGYTLDN